MPLLPISAIIPTLNRSARLQQTITSLLAQSVVPAEIIIIDASTPPENPGVLRQLAAHLIPAPLIIVLTPIERGAATQRNQGQASATQPFLLFLDDDVDLESGCVAALWSALQADDQLGGCGAVITNQFYNPPGPTMRRIFHWLGCPADGSLAGRCCGPALNFLPTLQGEGRPAGSSVDWLNLCCTLFRQPALPQPALLPFFHGYSLLEDAALTLHVSRNWRLAISPAARVYHDTRPAPYKNRTYAREKMEVINRWFVMRHLLDRNDLGWDLRQCAYQGLMLLLSLSAPGGLRRFPAALAGKIAGWATVLLHGHQWRGYNRTPQL